MDDDDHESDLEREFALELIGRIYDATFRPALWNEVVENVVHFVGGTRGLLFTARLAPSEGGFQFPYRLPESFLQVWNDRYFEHDVWSRNALARGLYREGMTMLDRDLASESELIASRAYREMLEPVGIGRLCAGVVFGEESSGLPTTVCNVYRALHDVPFEEAQRKRMELIVPHLSRALGILFRLRDAELKIVATRAALNRLASGVLLIDRRGHVSFANAAAKRIAEQLDGLVLTRCASGPRRLTGETCRFTALIDDAIGRCLALDATRVAHFSRGVTVPRPSGKRGYLLQVAPLPTHSEFGAASAAAAIVFVTDPEAETGLDPALLTRLYRLTPAEVRLAQFLFSGSTVSEAAARLEISAYTARTHLKRIFTKLGVSRQPELMRLLAGLASTSSK